MTEEEILKRAFAMPLGISRNDRLAIDLPAGDDASDG